MPLTSCVTSGKSFLFCASASPSVIGADVNHLLGEALVCKNHVWLSHAFSLYSKSFLNHSVWLIRFYVSPNIFKRNVSLCPAAVPCLSSFHRQLRLLLSATLGCWNLAPHAALWCGIGTRRVLPSSNAQSETMQWNVQAGSGWIPQLLCCRRCLLFAFPFL